MIFQEQINDFLETSHSTPALFVRGTIIFLITISAGLAIAQLLDPDIFGTYSGVIESFEKIVLVIFTLEFALRVYAADSMRSFWDNSSNWIDLVSIVPFYFGINNSVILRLFRVLRIMRLSRGGILDFLERPQSIYAISARVFIMVLIILSAGFAVLELLFPTQFEPYQSYIRSFEYFALGIFTVEFFARFFASHSLSDFTKRPGSWIDFMAIAPFYFGIDNAVILRIFRVLRLFKLFNSVAMLRASSIFDFKNSILRIVTPLIMIFVFAKAFVWVLESQGIWFVEQDFKTLFTIMGFSLGVVLSQKIGRSYGKYIQVQDGMYSLHGKLQALQDMLNTMHPKAGDRLIYAWLREFMAIYHSGKLEGTVAEVRDLNRKIYAQAEKIGNTDLIPFHRLAAMLSAMFEKAIFIQSKRTNRTPLTYNLLLQQIIIVYLVLLVVFIPGAQGLVSVVFAGYLLYGLFQITDDFDHVAGDADDGNLITVDAKRISNYLDELAETNAVKE